MPSISQKDSTTGSDAPCPLWKVEETIEEVALFCPENYIGEVIWKIAVEEFSHGLPELSLIELGGSSM